MFGVALNQRFDKCCFAHLSAALALSCNIHCIHTPGGPTTATTMGGGSSGSRSTRGTCSLFSLTYTVVRMSSAYSDNYSNTS